MNSPRFEGRAAQEGGAPTFVAAGSGANAIGGGLPYRPDIDGLRAIAVLLVLVFHFRLLPLGDAGFIGVDMFFVISGFLITSIIRRELIAGTFSLQRFYIARVRRLAPALSVVLLSTLVYGWLRLTPLEYVELGRQVAAAQFYVANVYYWRHVGYFGLGADSVYLLHTWSLAVEEQFYLVYPLALLAVYRWARRAMWPLLVGAAIFSFALNVYWVAPKPMHAFYLPMTRAWELLAGAMLAGVVWRPCSRAVNDSIGAFAAILLVAACVTHRQGTPVPGWFVVLPVVSALAWIIAAQDPRTTTLRVLSVAPLTWIGRVSYPLYLVHWPLHVFALREFGDQYGVGARFGTFLFSFVLAAGITTLVEAPLRQRRCLKPDGRLLAGYAVALALTGGVGLAIARADGVSWRVPEQVARLDAYVADRTRGIETCRYSDGWSLPPQPACRLGKGSEPPRWVVFGDSHAWAGFGAFSRWLEQRGEAGWLVYLDQCPPLTSMHLVNDVQDRCSRFNESIYAWLERSPDLDSVLLVSSWHEVDEGLLASEPRTRQPDPKKSTAVFSASFEASLKRLKAAAKNVNVWGPVPGGRLNVPRALALAIWRGEPAQLEWTRAEHEAQFSFFYEAARRQRNSIDKLILPATMLCESGVCRVVHDGTPLYVDSAHIAASQSQFWASVLPNEVNQVPPR